MTNKLNDLMQRIQSLPPEQREKAIARAKALSEKQGGGHAALAGFLDTATLGTWDKLRGLTTPGVPYDIGRDLTEAHGESLMDKNTAAYLAGGLPGAVLPGAGIYKGVQAAKGLGALGKATTTGAVEGGLYGAGSYDEGDPGSRSGEAGFGTALGAGLGAGLYGASRMIKRPADQPMYRGTKVELGKVLDETQKQTGVSPRQFLEQGNEQTTLADMVGSSDPGLAQSPAAGKTLALAGEGGKPSSVINERLASRARGANSRIDQNLEQNFPYTIEKEMFYSSTNTMLETVEERKRTAMEAFKDADIEERMAELFKSGFTGNVNVDHFVMPQSARVQLDYIANTNPTVSKVATDLNKTSKPLNWLYNRAKDLDQKADAAKKDKQWVEAEGLRSAASVIREAIYDKVPQLAKLDATEARILDHRKAYGQGRRAMQEMAKDGTSKDRMYEIVHALDDSPNERSKQLGPFLQGARSYLHDVSRGNVDKGNKAVPEVFANQVPRDWMEVALRGKHGNATEMLRNFDSERMFDRTGSAVDRALLRGGVRAQGAGEVEPGGVASVLLNRSSVGPRGRMYQAGATAGRGLLTPLKYGIRKKTLDEDMAKVLTAPREDAFNMLKYMKR